MSIRNAKGQMAIFFVLSFQMLFILFAMTINVTLVVHDKINLQNSLDLAVYYGASKQAEVLNAISHINYQMRQNYKLLAWRYRVLSSVTLTQGGELKDFPVYREAWCPQNREGKGRPCHPIPNSKCKTTIYPNGYCDIAYNVCVSASAWSRSIKDGQGSINICLNDGFDPPQIEPLKNIATFISANALAAAAQEKLRDSINVSCGKEKSLNKIMANLFLSHFRLDQKDRKIMIKAIYDASLKQGRDLDGNFIEDGARKVFRKNLNFTNQKNYRHQIEGTEFFNSLTERNFEEIFEAINILPILFFLRLDGTCGGNSVPLITNKEDFDTIKFKNFTDAYQDLFDLNMRDRVSNIDHNNLGTLTLGFSKKLEPLIFYAGISNLNYSYLPQLFSPKPSEVEKRQLKALSFAKPFGSQIGPDYNDKNIDPIIHPQILGNASTVSVDFYNSQPNYSRYPGDKWGLIDRQIHDPAGTPFLIKTDSNTGSPYRIDSFDHLQTSDALSRTEKDGTLIPNHFVRLMEMAAVFPDLFDLTYYNISPSYMTTYFPRICSLIGQGGSCGPIVYGESESQAFIRGDFGYDPQEAAMHGYYMQQNAGGPKIHSSIWPWFLLKGENKVGQPVNVKPFRTETTNFEDFTQMIRYPYWVQDPAHFLTSWLPPTINKSRYEDYSFPEDFAKCYKPTDKVPSACAVGGRAGYSVKLFSCNIAKTLNNKPAFADIECP